MVGVMVTVQPCRSAAWDRARRPKICKLRKHRVLARLVADKLQLQWSPVQIAGWLKQRSGGQEEHQVSHETIYRSLFIQARGALKRSSWRTCAIRARCAALAITRRRRPIMASSQTWSRSASVPPMSRAGPCPATGKAIC